MVWRVSSSFCITNTVPMEKCYRLNFLILPKLEMRQDSKELSGWGNFYSKSLYLDSEVTWMWWESHLEGIVPETFQ